MLNHLVFFFFGFFFLRLGLGQRRACGYEGYLLPLLAAHSSLFLPCKLIFWKATKVGSPPNFPKLISQLRGIPQSQYFVPSLLEPHWAYLWKHYIYHKKDTKVGSQILATKFGFVPDWLTGMYVKKSIATISRLNVSKKFCVSILYFSIQILYELQENIAKFSCSIESFTCPGSSNIGIWRSLNIFKNCHFEITFP